MANQMTTEAWCSLVPCSEGRRTQRSGECAYDGRTAPAGVARVCSSGRHRYRSTGQRWVREPVGALPGQAVAR